VATEADPLGTADQIASVVGAAAGIASLIVALKDRGRTGTTDHAVLIERRKWIRTALTSAAVFVAA
jgi:predicted Co/Zn/Cd cation transporter (cation efflux family)